MLFESPDAGICDYCSLTEPSPPSSVWADLRQLPKSFWLLIVAAVLSFSLQYTFMLFASDYLHEKWGLPSEVAGRNVAIIYAIALFGTPLVGYLLSFLRSAIPVVFAGSLIFAISLVYLSLIPAKVSPVPALVTLGISYSIVPTTMWLCISNTVSASDPSRAGLCFAIATAANSTTLLFLPFLVAALHDQFPQYGYDSVALVLAGAAIGGIVVLSYSRHNVPNDLTLSSSPSSTASTSRSVSAETTPSATPPSTPSRTSIDEEDRVSPV